MSLSYRQFRQVGREQWVTERNLFRRTFVRLFGPLGVHARIRNARAINAINRLSLPDRAKILDAGSGHAYATFWLARHYPQYQISALDFDRDLAFAGQQLAERLGFENVHFGQADVADMDEVAAYDLIFSIDLLEHIVDDVGILRAFRRALHPQGQLLLHLPRRHQEHHRFFPAFKEHTTPEHVRDEYTADEIRERLVRSGFEIEHLGYGFSMWGELAFELNYLFWKHNTLRVITALLTHPLCVWLAYMDTRKDYDDGNSLLVLSRPATARG
ncbi:MAG: class I SAM-dependent methyltransferase [Anaerolineales bacterium]